MTYGITGQSTYGIISQPLTSSEIRKNTLKVSIISLIMAITLGCGFSPQKLSHLSIERRRLLAKTPALGQRSCCRGRPLVRHTTPISCSGPRLHDASFARRRRHITQPDRRPYFPSSLQGLDCQGVEAWFLKGPFRLRHTVNRCVLPPLHAAV
jgi:hypothetical protein